jgi:diaminopimelate decarboxylase/aspartate kinase
MLAELHYDEALEMAASGARVVHPDCIRTAAATSMPVIIRDCSRPRLNGTRITGHTAGSSGDGVSGVKAIVCQKDMEVLLLQNKDSRRHVGFLARAFDVFRRHGISIDLVATSETTTTVSINGPANHLNDQMRTDLVADLQSQCMVEVFSSCVCINLVGRAARTSLARLKSTLSFFNDHPLLMLSQSANDLCLSILVESRDHERLLASAHAELIPSGSDAAAGIFGARWMDIARQS